jgi:hypothetical protein
VLPKALALHIASLGHGHYDQTGDVDTPKGHVLDLPDKPDLAWCVYPRAGFPARDLSGYVRPELQVIYRTAAAAGHQAGYDGAEAIRRDLDRTCRVVWAAGTEHEQYVLTCDANEPEPVYLGPDAVGRPRWSVSVQTELTKEVTP